MTQPPGPTFTTPYAHSAKSAAHTTSHPSQRLHLIARRSGLTGEQLLDLVRDRDALEQPSDLCVSIHRGVRAREVRS